jgi:transketolase
VGAAETIPLVDVIADADGQSSALSPGQMAALEEVRRRLAVWSIRMTTAAGSGHPSTCLSASHLITALYFGDLLRVEPTAPRAPDRDRFILSKGHAAPILYAALAERGYFGTDELLGLRRIDSRLEGHPNMLRVPGVEASTGSLGQGLSIGIGHALAARLDGLGYNTWVMTGDGELNQGQIWEAALAAAKYELDNLVCIVDRNGYQQTGASDHVLPLDALVDKWRAFGWKTFEIDGHDWNDVVETLRAAAAVRAQPAVVVAWTIKGFGVSRIENDTGNKFHGVPLSAAEAEEAIAEILHR